MGPEDFLKILLRVMVKNVIAYFAEVAQLVRAFA